MVPCAHGSAGVRGDSRCEGCSPYPRGDVAPTLNGDCLPHAPGASLIRISSQRPSRFRSDRFKSTRLRTKHLALHRWLGWHYQPTSSLAARRSPYGPACLWRTDGTPWFRASRAGVAPVHHADGPGLFRIKYRCVPSSTSSLRWLCTVARIAMTPVVFRGTTSVIASMG